MTEKSRRQKKIAVIVAHPDDETLWAGGTILSHCDWQVYVLSLCRGDDKDRAPKFGAALDALQAKGAMGCLDDGVEQHPLAESEVQHAVFALLPPIAYDLIITHNPSGDLSDRDLAEALGIEKKVSYATNTISRDFMPYLIGACDIYAAPSRLEGFGMPQIEAGACGKPVIGIRAMGMLDTLVHGETAFLADVARKIVVGEVTLGRESGYEDHHIVQFEIPRTVNYRADVTGIAKGLLMLMKNSPLRIQMGMAGRKRVVDRFDYRLVAKRFVEIIQSKLGID